MTSHVSNSLPALHLDTSNVPPLAKMLISNEMAIEAPRKLTRTEKLDRLLFSVSHRYFNAILLVCVHALAFALALAYYNTNAVLAAENLNISPIRTFARATALVLHCEVALLLLPVCRTLISTLKTSPLRAFFQGGDEASYHQLIAWSMVFFAWIHTIAHWINYAGLAKENGLGFKGFLQLNFSTGSGLSGYILLVALMLFAANSRKWVQINRWSRFAATHHIYILFFVVWSVHGAFAGTGTKRSTNWVESASFWQYWLFGGSLYLIEKAVREIRGRYKTHISKVIQHESHVIEIQMKKKQTAVKVAQVRIRPSGFSVPTVD